MLTFISINYTKDIKSKNNNIEYPQCIRDPAMDPWQSHQDLSDQTIVRLISQKQLPPKQLAL
ncbi:hypothetical protein DKW60_01040 [Leucothrix pacifica]|uniref:Uncharacterized protein n=1 Tax=Leucothrix pacifica TaxID=1247513 RepID=A0A317CVA0_9GAMM|nr:hypothetical protein DKW60_01040 [Leucothrix pacifica]